MFGLRSKGDQIVGCSNSDCPVQRFPAKELYFLCPGATCPGYRHSPPGRPEAWAKKTLFQPRRYAYSVPCPHSPHTAYLKVCPHCWTQQPIATGRLATISIVGSSVSGKTCYVTGLIRQIEKELSKEASYQMALEWDDQDGLNYFTQREREIFIQGVLPEATQKDAPVETLEITARFPVRGWRRLLKGTQGTVSLVFPDPAGEFFHKMDDAYYLNYLSQSRAIILMVDPWLSQEYQSKRRDLGSEIPAFDAPDAGQSLNSFIQAVRHETNQRGKLRKELAVVLTKCDEVGLFDPDDQANPFPVQGRYYDPRLTDQISRQVKQFLELELGLSKVVALAEQGFRSVRFFAASALGSPPIRVVENGRTRIKLKNPRPRRVEDPVLWILHEWGYW
jgi:hypothetical protein